jgi:hypothetical protein
MRYETAGDPMGGLKWTRKTTAKIAFELKSVRIKVSRTTVGNILKKIGYSLKTNVKKLSSGGKTLTKAERENRNRQFAYINETRARFNEINSPAVSVDTKKKEMIGNFKNPGTRYKRQADLTNDHDFLTYAEGKAALYGVYDQKENIGFVSIGMFIKTGKSILSADTPEFAVESIERWWHYRGSKTYPNTEEILILADAGGSNGYRSHLWKIKLLQILCDRHGIRVTVCHYPPGASKWNPIEHRLFSEISKNWQGTPLIDYETVYQYTVSTKTTTGLQTEAILVSKQYEKGLKACKEDMENLNIQRHESNPVWNYTLSPRG